MILQNHIYNLIWKGKDVMCGQVWWPILGICALHLTHPSAHTQWTNTHTHTMNTHPEQWATIYTKQLRVRCLAQGYHLSRGIEGGESAVHSLPPPTMPAGPETRTRDLWVTSPTLYPLGHDCPTCWFVLKKHFLLSSHWKLWCLSKYFCGNIICFHHSLMTTTT